MSTNVTALSVALSERQSSAPVADGSTGTQTTVTASLAASDGNGDVFGLAVSVAPSAQTAAATQRAQDGLNAIATLKQSAQQAHDFNKSAAGTKLALAIKELALLKLLGNGIAGAREAVKLAKEVADAVSLYATGSGGDTGTFSDIATASDTPAASAPAGSAGAGVTGAAGDTTIDPGETATAVAAPVDAPAVQDAGAGADPATATSGTPATGIAATPPASLPTAATTQQDPFYALANAVLAELKKYLKKVLPPLQNSPDPKVKAEARRLGRDFDKAVDTIQEAEQTSTADVPAAATVATPSVAVNLVA
jgi:hypothetical protein